MSIQVVGVLTDPLGNPMESPIRFTAYNSNIAIQGAEGIVQTASDGSYDFQLMEGSYLVQLFQEDEYTEGVLVQVDGTTPSGITLGTLLKDHVLVGE